MLRKKNRTLTKFSLLSLVLFLLIALQENPFPAQEAAFSKPLYPLLKTATCRSCHNPDGVASVTRLIFPEADASAEQIEAFGKSLVGLVNRENPAESFLLTKPTKRIPHAGGERIKQGSAEEDVLKAWVQRLAKMSDAELASALKLREEEAASGKRPTVALRRLTHSQYNNTVRDLLGDQSAPANQFPPEDFVNGFKNQYQAQSLSPLLVEAYSAAGERLARNAFLGGDRRALIPHALAV